jgi:hypothetical protein
MTWDCNYCGEPLAEIRDGMLYLRFGYRKKGQLLASWPATATCGKCGQLNHRDWRGGFNVAEAMNLEQDDA